MDCQPATRQLFGHFGSALLFARGQRGIWQNPVAMAAKLDLKLFALRLAVPTGLR
jgi:hypothetical protein